MSRSEEKTRAIFESTLAILKESGDHGLSMRGVAEHAGISLGNLQYHFKTREDLISGLLGYFLDACMADYRARLDALSGRPRDKIKRLLLHALEDESTREWYPVFKVLWAVAERDDRVRTALDEYYRGCLDRTIDLLRTVAPKGCRRATLGAAASLLVPWVEGMMIAGGAISDKPETVAGQMAGVTVALLEGGRK